MMGMPRYPIGEQSFEALRRGGFLYVDKTRYIHQIVTAAKYYFLARPRRFGKSLFLSTLKSFFEGKRELFGGLYIDSVDWNWEPHPVLYLDLNLNNSTSRESLKNILFSHLTKWESEYGITNPDREFSIRFQDIIKAAFNKTGKSVVILVDEYDKPLINNMADHDIYEESRELLTDVYSNFKSSADYLRLVFLTGVSRMGKLTVFSGLNNIQDISFDNDYSAVCGITERELCANFREGIERLAESDGLSYVDTLNKLKHYYDGYKFAPYGECMYNPFSLLQVMQKRTYKNYWIESGTSTLLLEQLKKVDADLEEVINMDCTQSMLYGLDIDGPTPVALLYQTGYITIKGYDREMDLYKMGLPNREVTEGFFDFLLPYYARIGNSGELYIKHLALAFRRGNAEEAMERIQSLFASVPSLLRMESENTFHAALYMVTKLLSFFIVEAESHTSDGRVDLLALTDKYCYIIEIKMDQSAEKALSQIEEKRYDLPRKFSNQRIIKIGANFSSKSRTLENWIIEK